MIIAISSVPPIDTTNAARQLAEKHNLNIIENPVPQICKGYGFQTLYDMPIKLQSEVREKIIYDHLEFVKSNDNLLLNFSITEFIADWMRWFWMNTPTEKWEDIMTAASATATYYDEIYHIETGEEKEYDGYIWFDKRNHSQINSLLKYIYPELKLSEKIKTL